MITELVQEKHFSPYIGSQAGILCFAEIPAGFQEEQTTAQVSKPELPQMLSQKDKNRSAFGHLKRLNRASCSQRGPHETP